MEGWGVNGAVAALDCRGTALGIADVIPHSVFRTKSNGMEQP